MTTVFDNSSDYVTDTSDVLAPNAHPTARSVADFIRTFGGPFLLVVGLPGNFVSYLILNSRAFQSGTSGYYMRVIAIFDSVYLIGKFLERVIITQVRAFLLEKDVLYIVCYQWIFTYQTATGLSRYLLIAYTFNRMIALAMPLKSRSLCTMKTAKGATVFVILFSLTHGVPMCFAVYMPIYANSWVCPWWLAGELGAWYNFIMSLLTFTCCVLLLSANIVIVLALYRSHRERKKLSSDESRTNSINQNSQISMMLLSVSFVYIMTNVPREVYLQYSSRNPEWSQANPDLNSMGVELAIFTEALNYAINFFLYLISCRKFRRILLGKVSCHKAGDAQKSTSCERSASTFSKY